MRNLNDLSEAEQVAAMLQDGNEIYYIKNPSEAVCLAAVTQTGLAVQYIDNPSAAVQVTAVQKLGERALRLIKGELEPAALRRLADLIEQSRSTQAQEKPSTHLDDTRAEPAVGDDKSKGK